MPRKSMSVPSFNLESAMTDHGPFLRRLAQSLVRNSADADDLVQDVWIAAAGARSGVIREPRAWLATVLRRRAASEGRRLRPESLGGAAPETQSRESAQDEVLHQLERETKLQQALVALEEPYRSALYLRFHDGLKPKAIAERMDVPVKTVNSWLHRGLQKLRDELDGAYGGGEEGRAAWLSGMALLATGGRAASHAAPSAASGIAGAKISSAAVALVAGLAVATVGAGLWWHQRTETVAPLGEPPIASSSEVTLAGVTGPAAGALAATGPAKARTLAGSAVDPAGSLAPGAGATASAEHGVEVVVTACRVSGEPVAGHPLVLTQRGWSGTPGAESLLTTDANGRVAFQVDPDLKYQLSDMLGSNWLYLDDELASLEEGGTLSKALLLRPTTAVSGRVVDSVGEPQPGATIYATYMDNRGTSWFPIAEADAAGHYAIEAGDQMLFEAVVPGRLPSEAVLPMRAPANGGGASGAREVDLVIGPVGATLSGRVVDGEGTPVEGAAVTAGLFAAQGEPLDHTRRPSPVLVFTDANGRFEYPVALPSGEQPIAASAPGYATNSFVESFDGEPKELTITLTGGVTIEGRVVRPDGSPAAGASVALSDPEARWWDTFYGPRHGDYTDDEGRFELIHVGAEAGELRARHADGAVLKARLAWTRSENEPAGIQLAEGQVIAGRVVDEYGQPLQGLVVDGTMGNFERTDGLIMTDEDGKFRLSSLPHPSSSLPEGFDARWKVSVRTNDNSMRVEIAAVEGVSPGTLDLEIVAAIPAPTTAFIEGRIAGFGDGIPPNTTLFLSQQTGKKLTEETNRAIDFDPATGDFHFGPIAPGTYGLVIYLPNSGEIASLEGIVVGDGDVKEVGEISSANAGAAEVTLSVELPDIFPEGQLPGLIRDQQLELVSAHRRYEMKSIDGGWRTAHPMPPGTYELQRRSGEVLCIPRVPVTIEAGVNAEVQVQAVVGRPMMIWALMDPAADWGRVELRFYSQSNELMQVSRSRTKADLNEEEKLSFRDASPLGLTRIEVWMDGVKSNIETTVEVLYWTEPMDPLTIDAR